jgi:uncharacterized protein
MIPLLEDRLEDIVALCREYGVARLEVFGSAATGAFDPARSDVDFLVEYAPGTNLGPWLTRFFELRDRLAALLGHSVDLIMADAPTNPYFVRSVNATRRLLYAA